MNHKNNNMPRISTKQVVRVRDDKNGIDKGYLVDTHYTKGRYSNDEPYFFIYLPNEHLDGFEHLSDSVKEKLHATSVWISQKRSHCPIVKGDSEAEVISRMAELIKVIMTAKIKRRDVIILEVEIEGENNSWKRYEPGMERIGMGLGVFYCQEVKAGSAPATFYKKVGQDDEEEEERGRMVKVDLDDDDPIAVIDDTPENRKFIEDLYTAFKVLVSKMKKHTKTAKSILSLIASQANLLPPPNQEEITEANQVKEDVDE